YSGGSMRYGGSVTTASTESTGIVLSTSEHSPCIKSHSVIVDNTPRGAYYSSSSSSTSPIIVMSHPEDSDTPRFQDLYPRFLEARVPISTMLFFLISLVAQMPRRRVPVS